MTHLRPLRALPAALLFAGAAHAQWNPPTGQWGKLDPADVRVMTYNIEDALCTSQAKVEGANSWCAIARLVASFKPDVLLLQECGDNAGNGGTGGLDTVAELQLVVDDFLHGGLDSFNGNTPVTSWVQKYAAGYDLPFVLVANDNDGFNRNVILSRFPFADLNGDGKSSYSDIPTVSASQYATGGDGGIRGFQFVELDLPDATYTGDLVVGGAHLKSGGQTADHDERVKAAQNVAYVVRYWYAGNGTPTPDPLNRIADSPPATSVLGPDTAVILGGDWNEDELANGAVKGPADWLIRAAVSGGSTDGTDVDGTDSTLDSALNFFTGSDNSHSSGGKLDYLAWQDSIASFLHATIFISGSTPGGAQPPEMSGYPSPSGATSTASDHRPVFADWKLPVVDCNGNQIADTTDIALGNSIDANANSVPDECESDVTPFCFGDGSDPNILLCPCGNFGNPGHGCGNSVDPAGALLVATGGTDPDTLVLTCSNMPDVPTIFLKGNADNLTGAFFGDGVRCAAGALIRLGLVNSVGGTSQYPGVGQNPVSVNGLTPPGSGMIGYYQTYYRNPAPTFCPPETFNISNGVRIVW